MEATKERKKYEAEINRPFLKDKLSQTGWKIRENFLKKSNINMDEKDRIDVFGGDDQPGLKAMLNAPNISGGSGMGIDTRRIMDDSDSDGDCMILDYEN